MPKPEPNNDNILDEISRRVYHKVMKRMEKMLDGEGYSPDERLTVLAAVAESCTAQIMAEDGDDDTDVMGFRA